MPFARSMLPTPKRLAAAPAFCLLFAFAAGSAAAADCDTAIRHATDVAARGDRALQSQNYVDAGNAASSARIPAIDAWQHAKACGCAEAVPLLEDATLAAARANNSADLTAARLYGARIKKDADAAIEILRRCAPG
jgi:hypothetical protein